MTKEKQEALGDKDAYVIKVLKLEALIDELQKDSGQQNKKSTEQTVVGWLCCSHYFSLKEVQINIKIHYL